MNLPSVNRLLAGRVCQRSFDFSRTVRPKRTKIEERIWNAGFVWETAPLGYVSWNLNVKVYVIDKLKNGVKVKGSYEYSAPTQMANQTFDHVEKLLGAS